MPSRLGRPWRTQYTLDMRNLDSGIVLADALEQQGYEQLGRALSRRIRKIVREHLAVDEFNPADNALLHRVVRAIETIEQRKKGTTRAFPKRGRSRSEQPLLRQSYDYFRKRHHMGAKEAMAHARAEQFFLTHDWTLDVQPEDQRYQDVYGYSKENAEIEKKYDFIWIGVLDSRFNPRDSIGFIEDTPDQRRYYRALLTLQAMPSRRGNRSS